MWIIPNQSEKLFVSRFMKNDKKSIRLIPRHQSEWIRTKFLIQPNPIIPTLDSFGLILIENSVWINPSSDWFGCIRIDVSELIGSIFYRFSSNEIQNVSRIGWEWFALARIQISEYIGIVLIELEWIPIRYFRQGLDNFIHHMNRYFIKTLSLSWSDYEHLATVRQFYFTTSFSLQQTWLSFSLTLEYLLSPKRVFREECRMRQHLSWMRSFFNKKEKSPSSRSSSV